MVDNSKIIGDFRFGTIGDKCAISHLGIAIKDKSGTAVSYDKSKNEIVNVELINFSKQELVYEMPVAIKDVKVGDCVIHKALPMFVTEVAENGDITAVDAFAGEKKIILPTKNMFGFNYIQKVVSLVDMSNVKASEDNPFGNMLPLMMLSDDKMDMSTMLMFSMMNGNKDFKFDMSNPMMMLALMGNKNGGSNDIAPFLMMTMMNQKNK